MAYNHLLTIQTKAKNLSALTSSAADFITVDNLNVATRKFIKYLPDADSYTTYMDYLDTEAYDPTKLYYALTDEEKQIDCLVSAETYFALSVLAFALRKMDKNAVHYKSEEFGDGEINPVLFDDIQSSAEKWESKARLEIANANLSDDDSSTPANMYYAAI